MEGILASLHTIPQFAYLPGRNLNDALARGNQRMELIRTSLKFSEFSTANRFDQRTIRENTQQGGRWLHPVCGGAVLSIDLHKAFDMVSRRQLAATLAELKGPKKPNRRRSASTRNASTTSAWKDRGPQCTQLGGHDRVVD